MNDDIRFKPVCRRFARSGEIAISNREQQHVDFALSSSKAVMSRPSFARFFGLKIHAEVRVETVICIDLRQRLKRLGAGNEWHRGQHDCTVFALLVLNSSSRISLLWFDRFRDVCVPDKRLPDCGHQVRCEVQFRDIARSAGSQRRVNIVLIFVHG